MWFVALFVPSFVYAYGQWPRTPVGFIYKLMDIVAKVLIVAACVLTLFYNVNWRVRLCTRSVYRLTAIALCCLWRLRLLQYSCTIEVNSSDLPRYTETLCLCIQDSSLDFYTLCGIRCRDTTTIQMYTEVPFILCLRFCSDSIHSFVGSRQKWQTRNRSTNGLLESKSNKLFENVTKCGNLERRVTNRKCTYERHIDSGNSCYQFV